MNNLLVKIANKIIHKNGCFTLDLKSKIIVNGMIFTITEINQTSDCFKNDISIKASDLIPVPEWKN